jgi:hypothetical protein
LLAFRYGSIEVPIPQSLVLQAARQVTHPTHLCLSIEESFPSRHYLWACPSAKAGAAWWALTILAHNLNAAMKRLVLGKDWSTKRMKAMRFRLIGLPGQVISHARQLVIRLGAGLDALETIIAARRIIQALAHGPAG